MSINHALAVRSDFSIGESLLQLDHIIDKAKEFGYESVALTDTMSLHAMVAFTNKAKKAGIRPIIGCRIRVVKDPLYRPPAKATGIKPIENPMYFIKAYAIDQTGIESLFTLLSKAASKEYFYYHSRVGIDDVMDLKGVVISTGDMGNVFHMTDYEEIVCRLNQKFHTFIELNPIDTPLFDTLNDRAIRLIREKKYTPLVTYPFFYREDQDAPSLEVLSAITSNKKMDSPARPIQYVQTFGFAPSSKLLERMKSASLRQVKWYAAPTDVGNIWVEGVKNIQKLVDMCAYKFEKMGPCLPKMAENEFGVLGKKCIEGWKRRFSTPVLGYLPSTDLIPVYQERLRYELSVLKNMNFSGYFLLVEDLVNWAKDNGIIVGPGRGSVGGSLVAYLLGITDVDPIRFNLLFERFINPERQDLPDADLDFMSSKRHLIAEYLTTKYGADHVAGISNFTTLASASALRDSGRVYGLMGIDMMATKLVPKEHGRSFTLTEAATVVPEIDKFKNGNETIWNHALKLEGVMRSFGQHAAGIVVSGEPLINRAVVETRSESPVVNWDKRDVEDWGLIKMDILGLSTLDALEIAKAYIKDRHGITVDYLKLPLEEPDIMKAFGNGDTTGVFQFESSGMKGLLRSLAEGGTLTFEDITAATALYRPGPMDSGLMDDFIQIKQGHKIPYYEHKNMENALESTYGVIVYQEQVMQLSVDLAGFTKAEADHLRKAMGKKDREKMAEMRDKWVKGCVTTSAMDETQAGYLFDKIEAFAGYGFNRSHAVEYSLISYWTMWVRVRYPAEYFAACMSIVKEEKLPGLVGDARSCGIEVLPPDINRSTDRYTIPDDSHILAPFSSVKGVSENTAQAIMKLRNKAGGSFATADDFKDAAAQPKSKVNVRVVSNLEKVGALAHIQPGSLPPRHLDRRKDQTELMPGLIIDAVKADRHTDMSDKFMKAKIISIVSEYQECEDCDLKDKAHPGARLKNIVKFMVVSDCPSWQEEKKNLLLEGDAGTVIKSAIKAAKLSVTEGYYTTLVKAKKEGKILTNEQINGCTKFIERELEIVRPPIIVALGSASIRYFLPGVKTPPSELAGKVIYDAKREASIVCGINPQQIAFDPSKSEIIDAVFEKVAEILE